MGVVSKRVHAALSKETTVHLLPAHAIMLDDWLVRDPEGTASRKAPICGIKPYRGLLKRFARAAERKEALCVQGGEYENKDVKGEVGNRCDLVRHCRKCGRRDYGV